jgi:hypothetical protein
VLSKEARGKIVAGAVLDLVGAVLIARGVPEIGLPLAAGVVLLLAGSLLVFQGVLGISKEQAQQQPPSAGPSSGWRPEPELRAPPPRRVVLTRTGKLSMALWAAMAVVVAGYAFLAPPRPASLPPLFEAEGVAVTGTVHDKNERNLAVDGQTYYVYYNFQTQDGAQVRASRSVPRRVYDDVAVGDTLEIVYFSDDPHVHFAGLLEREELPPAVRWIVAGALAALVFGFDHQRRYHRRLVSQGTAVAGTVEGVRRRGANRVFTVRFQLHAHQGSLRGSERNPQRADGDLVTVLYLPERPERAVLYSATLYRARLS